MFSTASSRLHHQLLGTRLVRQARNGDTDDPEPRTSAAASAIRTHWLLKAQPRTWATTAMRSLLLIGRPMHCAAALQIQPASNIVTRPHLPASERVAIILAQRQMSWKVEWQATLATADLTLVGSGSVSIIHYLGITSAVTRGVHLAGWSLHLRLEVRTRLCGPVETSMIVSSQSDACAG